MFVFDAVTINQLRSAALPDSEFFRRPTVGRELFIKDWPEGTLWDVDQNSNADAQDDDERAEFRERPRGTGFTIAGDATQVPGIKFQGVR
jgi:hypothetical protein